MPCHSLELDPRNLSRMPGDTLGGRTLSFMKCIRVALPIRMARIVDLNGITSKLDYLQKLGVDAI